MSSRSGSSRIFGHHEHVEHGGVAVFGVGERRIERHVADAAAEHGLHLAGRHVEQFGQFLIGRFALKLLHERIYASFTLLYEPTLLSGIRTMRLFSTIACRMLWRIHHTA
jgi:hypothetical protein